MRTRRFRVLTVSTLWLAAAGCSPAIDPGAGTPAPACDALRVDAEPRKRNVVFVLADTLRRDRIGAYGGAAATPNLDAFADAHLRFDAAWTQAPWTKPSMATLFTGLYPSQHGVLSHPSRKMRGGPDARRTMESDVLAAEARTLAEALSDAGYLTTAFVSNPWLKPDFGFDQGFATYEHQFADNQTPGTRVTSAGLDWLAAESSARPFFLYLHYMDAHSPYPALPDAVVAANRDAIAADDRPLSRDARRAIASHARTEDGLPLSRRGIVPNRTVMELVYDEGVKQLDRALGPLLAALRERDDWDELAVVITSDHGEALFARGFGDHGFGLYEDELAIPLLAKLPGISATGPVDCPVGLVDLRSSLCDYLGIECAREDAGRSLLGRAEPAQPRHLSAEGVVRSPGNRTVRGRRYKLVHQPSGSVGPAGRAVPVDSLFDLERDPDELRDLLEDPKTSEAARPVADRLRAALATSVPDDGALPRGERAVVDESTQERLEALGYVE